MKTAQQGITLKPPKAAVLALNVVEVNGTDYSMMQMVVEQFNHCSFGSRSPTPSDE